ncbi:MAG: hypothetical protein KGM24_01990 [Elusimicrobia bacterium]|nr:hypothetical protein [Elusimicrobiota bacterium]
MRALDAEIGVDPRVELVGAVQWLASRRRPAVGLGALTAALSPFRRDPAAAAYARLREEALGLTVQLLSGDERLAWVRPRLLLSADFVFSVGGDAGLDALLDSLRAFARRSRFFHLISRHAAAYEPSVARARAEWEASGGQRAALRRYLGEELDARLRIVVCGLYEPGRYDSYILPYPYPRPGEERPPAGPFEVVTLIRPGAGGFQLDRPLESGRLMELLYCWAEPFLWAHRREVLGSAPRPGDQQRTTRVLVEALGVRACAAAGLRARFAPPRGPLAARVLRALARYERGRRRWPRLSDFAPELARAMRGAGMFS